MALVATQTAVQERGASTWPSKARATRFSNKAIFGTSEGIERRKELLLEEVKEEISRARDDNERKLEASLRLGAPMCDQKTMRKIEKNIKRL